MKATYHTDTGDLEQRLDVLSKNEDGTVNLGRKGAGEDGKDVLVVGQCKVAAERVIGRCVLDGETPAAPVQDPEKPEKDPEDPASEDPENSEAEEPAKPARNRRRS